MRDFRASVAISTLLLFAPFPTQAALLSLLGSSTLDLRVGRLGGEAGGRYVGSGPCPGYVFYKTLPPIQFSMNMAGVLVSTPMAGGFLEPAGIFTGTRTQTFPAIATSPDAPFFFCSGSLADLFHGVAAANLSNGSKSIAPGAAGGGHTEGVLRPGGGLGGPGALAGTFLINVLGFFNLQVPLSPVGSTGTTAQRVAGTLEVTVLGTGWTTASVQVTGVTTATTPTSNAALVNTVTFVGYDNRTAGHVGRVLLVSPFKVITNAAGNLPGVAMQTLVFVPEPASLVLLAAGTATLALLGSRRMRG